MKNITGAVVFIMAGALFVVAGINMYGNIHLDPRKQDQITGKVTWVKVVFQPTTGRYSPRYRTLLEFQLDTIDEPFGVVHHENDHSRLSQNIRVGDTVTVYFHRRYSGGLNTNVYQIEKEGQVIMPYTSVDYEYLIQIFWIVTVGLTVWGFSVLMRWYRIKKQNKS